MEIPGYNIIDTLGRGGMATVYLAIQQSFEREVALKVLSPDLLRDPAFGERFLREAKIVARLIHPNIVTVYDVGVHDGHHYMSMEYIDGQDLKQKRSKLGRAQGLKIVKDIALALDYAARKGYVHRDVKPENIMLRADDGRAVLMDFGIARSTGVESGMTQTGTAIGTPHYMSPEQAKGKAVDARSDLYSLGVVLFLLVTGRVPFDADSAVAVGIKHVAEAIPRLPAAFGIFQPIIDKVLAKNPDRRYQTGSELVDDLELIDDEQLRRVDELIELSAKSLEKADHNAPTVVSSAFDTSLIAQAEQDTLHFESDSAIAQHWPHSGQSVSIQSIGERGAQTSTNPFGTSHWLRNSMLLTLLAGSAVFVFRQELPAPWPEQITAWHHAGLNWAKAQGVPLKESYWNRLYTIGQAEAVHASFTAPTPVVAAPIDAPAAIEAAPGIAESKQQGLANQVLADTRPVLGADGVISRRSQAAVPTVDEAPSAMESPSTELASAVDDPFERAAPLFNGLSENLQNAQPLAEIYREQLQQPAQSAKAQQGIEQIRAFYADALLAAFEANDLARVRVLLNSVGESFPDLAAEARLRKFSRRLASAEQVEDWLASGQQQLSRDALSAPSGDNAVESFRRVLAQESDNKRALMGLQAVADRYQQLASRKLETGDWLSAKGMVARGLALSPEHKQLLLLQQTVTEREKQLRDKQKQLSGLLQQAHAQRLAGNVYGRDGAVSLYRDMLALDADNRDALEGLRASAANTATQVHQLLDEKQFERAQQEFALADSLLSDQTSIIALKKELKIAVEASLPRVDSVRVGALIDVNFGEIQPRISGVDRTIYVGMQFHNFESTAVIQAILYDGSRSLQIAQVPVVVSGRQGEKVFRVDRPVEGFAAGGYNLDLMLGNQLLLSQRFHIDSP